MVYELAFVIYVIGNPITMHILYEEIRRKVIAGTDNESKTHKRGIIHWYVQCYSLNMNEAMELEEFNHNVEGQLISLYYAAQIVKITNFVMVFICAVLASGYCYLYIINNEVLFVDIPDSLIQIAIAITVFCTFTFLVQIVSIVIKLGILLKKERRKYEEYRQMERPSRQLGIHGHYKILEDD